MHTELITVPPETTLVDAMEIIKKKQIAHLLVVDKKNKLIGIVSDRDLKQNWASPATTLSAHELNYLLTKVTLNMIMVKKFVSVPPSMTIERAALTMQEQRIGALPVMEGEKLVGIITTTDVMGVLLQAIGIDKESTRFTVLGYDRIGFIAEISMILKEKEVNIRSFFAWPDKVYSGIYHFVVRVAARDGQRAISSLKENGFNVFTEYIDDITPYLPKTR